MKSAPGKALSLASTLLVSIILTCSAQSPALFNILPNTGHEGQEVVITGTNLLAITDVTFGDKPALFRIVSSTTLIALVPKGLIKSYLTVTGPSGSATSKQRFTSNLYVFGAEKPGTSIPVTDAITGKSYFELVDEIPHMVVNIGDQNGDGINDIAVGNPYSYDSTWRGAFQIFYMNRELEYKTVRRIDHTTPGFTGTLKAGDEFGQAIAPIGDLDEDGVPDLAVSSWNEITDEAAVWILFMKTDATVKAYQKIDQSTGGFIGISGEGFGHSLASLGDLDGDGNQELAVGGYEQNGNKGEVYILFLRKDGTVKKTTTLASKIPLSGYESFGFFIASIGDVNRDGVKDLAVGAPGDIYPGLDGAIWIVFLNKSGEAVGSSKITAQNGKFPNPAELSGLGESVCEAQDMNLDGIPDLIVNALNFMNPSKGGQLFSLLLNSDGSVLDNVLLEEAPASDDHWGDPMTFYGSSYDDGYPLIIFGSWYGTHQGLYSKQLGLPPNLYVSDVLGTWNNLCCSQTPVEFPATTAGKPVNLTFNIEADFHDDILRMPIEKPITTGEFAILTTTFPDTKGITRNEPFPFEVQFNAPKKGTYNGTVSITSGDLSLFPYTFNVTGTVINSTPDSIFLSSAFISENTASDTQVGTLSTIDADVDDTHTYSLASGSGDDDNRYFTVINQRLVLNQPADFESKNQYQIRIRSTDNDSASVEQQFSIFIRDTPDAPVVSNVSISLNENTADGEFVIEIDAFDQDGDIANYTISEGNTEQAFSLDSKTGQITVANSLILNYEIHPAFTLKVLVTDSSGLQSTGTIVITLIDINESPTDILLSNNLIDENSAAGTLIGLLSAVDEDANDKHNYSLTDGQGSDDNAEFVLTTDSLYSKQIMNFEQKSAYTIRVKATDQIGNTVEKIFTIVVNDINEADKLFIPNLFSPNGDGINDRFIIRCDEIVEVTLSIYSPLTGMIFTTSDPDYVTQIGWDGTHNGINLPSGVYIWQIQGLFKDGSPVSFQGEVIGSLTLIR